MEWDCDHVPYKIEFMTLILDAHLGIVTVLCAAGINMWQLWNRTFSLSWSNNLKPWSSPQASQFCWYWASGDWCHTVWPRCFRCVNIDFQVRVACFFDSDLITGSLLINILIFSKTTFVVELCWTFLFQTDGYYIWDRPYYHYIILIVINGNLPNFAHRSSISVRFQATI